MSKKTKSEAHEFNSLKKIGFELEAPQDEYSYQPDSGSTANGIIGKQEYGIDVNPDAQGRENELDGKRRQIEDSSMPIPGESEYSQKHRLPDEEIDENSVNHNDELLVKIVTKQLSQHPMLRQTPISVDADGGVVILQGEVRDDAAKLLFQEIIRDYSGVTSVINKLTISNI